MGKLNNAIRRVIGHEYLFRKLDIEEETPEVKAAFEEIVKVNNELFNQIPFQVVFTDLDMYQSAKEMREKVLATGKIYIYTGWGGHPYLSQPENNIGRAVHDVFAHLVCGCPFTFEGELTAYYEQRKWYPEWTWDVLFAEIPAQTCAYYANGKDHDFPQRAIKAPKDWLLWAELTELPDYTGNSILTFNKNLKMMEVRKHA